MRKNAYKRENRETTVSVEVNLDGTGKWSVQTPFSFFNHMLGILSTHSLIDLKVEAQGDLAHHVIEDTAIGVGTSLREALGEKAGITRFGFALVPMDCSLTSCALDLGGRPYSVIDLGVKGGIVEDTAVEDLTHFLESLATSLKGNLHIKVEYGRNNHHKVEAAFKALALCLRQAISLDLRRSGVPSSKGVL